MRKAGYIQSMAEAVVTKNIDLENLGKLSDNEVVKTKRCRRMDG